MWNRLGILVIGLLVLGACRSKKVISHDPADIPTKTPTESPNTGTAAAAFELSNLDFRTFSGKAKASLGVNEDSKDVNLNIRIAKDHKIWISVTAILGVEVARILITPDSVQIMNKLYGEYINKPFSYIHRYTNNNLTFGNIQDILMGNVSANLLHTPQLQIASSADQSQTQLIGKKSGLTYIYSINNDNKPVQLRMTEAERNQTMEVGYGQHVKTAGSLFPQLVKLRILGDQVKINAHIDYTRVAFDEVIETPFSVPAKYKVIN